MRFTKMHGAGNDYVYVNGFTEPVADPPQLARQISDRHFGVGSDGLVLILPSNSGDVRMRMFNSDGSEAEMCGNAIRCVAKYAFEHGLTEANPMRIETGRGTLSLSLQVESGKVVAATVAMGEPILESAQIPTTLPGPRVIDYPVPDFESSRLGRHWRDEAGLYGGMTCVSMGNPHAVFYCRHVERVPLDSIGPLIENSPIFPRRVNVHFVAVRSTGEVEMRTWERGSGITLACGTGACAVCVAGVLTGRGARQIIAHLPGGDLRLEWREKDNQVYLTGPAAEVFSGEWTINAV